MITSWLDTRKTVTPTTDLRVFMSIQEGANMVQMTEERKETRNMMQTILLPFIDMPKELHRKHVSM